MTDFTIARRNMVDCQVRTNKVWDDRLIDGLMQTGRELFVPKSLRGIAYIDEDLPLGDGRFLMEPMVLARIVQAAEISDRDVALVLGGGSGYMAAIVSRLCATVVMIERDAGLRQRATDALTKSGIDNVVVEDGNPALGHPSQAPYDVILFDGAVAEIPEAVKGQLTDGGRLVAVCRRTGRVGVATLVRNTGGGLSERPLFDANVPYLPGFEPRPVFAL